MAKRSADGAGGRKRTTATRARATKGRGTAQRKSTRAKAAVDWAPAFLAALAQTGNITAACQASGITRTAAYDRRRGDGDFRAAWSGALDQAADLLEAEARRRAIIGVTEPVFGRVERDKDGQVGTITRYSDSLLMFLLKAARPDRYRERIDVRHLSVDAIDAEIERLTAELGPEAFDEEARADAD